MNTFEEACRLSNARWLEHLPDTIETHDFSVQHEKKMKNIRFRKQVYGYSVPVKKAVQFAVLAAVLFSLLIAATVSALPGSGRFVLKRNGSDYTYQAENSGESLRNAELKLGDLPRQFHLSQQEILPDKIQMYFVYKEQHFTVEKLPLNQVLTFAANEQPEQEKKQEYTYVCYLGTDGENGVIWNDGNAVLYVHGNLSTEELMGIAKQTA